MEDLLKDRDVYEEMLFSIAGSEKGEIKCADFYLFFNSRDIKPEKAENRMRECLERIGGGIGDYPCRAYRLTLQGFELAEKGGWSGVEKREKRRIALDRTVTVSASVIGAIIGGTIVFIIGTFSAS